MTAKTQSKQAVQHRSAKARARHDVLVPAPRRRRRLVGDALTRQLMEAAPDALFVVACEGPDMGRILDANELAASMHGYTLDELLGLSIVDLDIEADAARVPERMARLRRMGSARFTVTHRRKDGSEFPVEVSARVGVVNGHPCLVAFNRDLSESRRALEELDLERTRLALAARAALIGFWDWDFATDVVYFSPEWKAQIGHAEDEIGHCYREWEQRVHPEDLPAVFAAIRSHLDGASALYEAHFRLRHKDGSWRRIHARGQLLRDAAGKPVRMLGCHVDVTAEYLAAVSRAETERVLRSFYEGPGVLRGVVELLPDDIRHVTANAEAARFFGTDAESMAGRLASELGAPPDAIELWLDHYRRCAREGRPVSFEYEHLTAAGVQRLFCTVSRSAAVESPDRFVFAAVDRTAQERATVVAAVATERMRAIYEADPHCIKTLDTQGRVLDINPAGLGMVGLHSLAQVRGRAMVEFVHPDDQAIVQRMHDRVLAGASECAEFRIVGVDGRVLDVASHAVPLRDLDGDVTSVLAVTRDVTGEKAARQQRDLMQRRLEQLQQLEAIGTLSGGIAHDFNNLLAVVSGNLQLALMQPGVPNEARECMHEIRKASDRACGLVKQILTFSRRHEPERCAVDFGAVVDEAARFLRATIPANIAIDLTVASSLPPVLGDATQLHQIVVNLGTNAWHAMQEHGGLLAIELDLVRFAPGAGDRPADARDGDHLRLRVADGGVGMDAATLAHIFEPFFTTKPCGKGTGLGLSVVHGVVRDHGGCIAVRSAPGAGAVFEVFLPVGAALELPRPEHEVAPAPASQRILLVDDEPALLRTTRLLLERSGHRVTTCSDPQQAVLVLQAYPGAFDLLITDQEMPGMNGLTLARRARTIAPHLAILLCSGFLSPEVIAANEADGRHVVVHKPATLERLSLAIGHAVELARQLAVEAERAGRR